MKKILYLLIATLLTSCAQYVPLTEKLIKDYHLSSAALAKLQVYNSSEITLQNGTQSSMGGLKDGKLVLSSYTQLNDVVLPLHTPGLISGTITEGFLIKFDKGSDGVLLFGPLNGYTIMADWNRSGEILYEGKKFYLPQNQSDCRLLVKVKSLKKVVNSVKTIKGNRL